MHRLRTPSRSCAILTFKKPTIDFKKQRCHCEPPQQEPDYAFKCQTRNCLIKIKKKKSRKKTIIFIIMAMIVTNIMAFNFFLCRFSKCLNTTTTTTKILMKKRLKIQIYFFKNCFSLKF